MEGVEKEATRRLQRRTSIGVISYGYRTYAADDLLREYLQTEAGVYMHVGGATAATVQVQRVAGGRGRRVRLRGGRYGKLAH